MDRKHESKVSWTLVLSLFLRDSVIWDYVPLRAEHWVKVSVEIESMGWIDR